MPWSTEAITTAWLNDVLCASHPGAKVLSMDLGSGTSGTTSRRKIKVTYNDAGTEASLPTRLFNKATASLTSRLVLGLSGCLVGESGFYTKIRPELDVEALALIERMSNAVVDNESLAAFDREVARNVSGPGIAGAR